MSPLRHIGSFLASRTTNCFLTNVFPAICYCNTSEIKRVFYFLYKPCLKQFLSCAQFRQSVPDILCTIHTVSIRYSVHNSHSQYQIFCAQFSQYQIFCEQFTVSTRYSVHNSVSQYQIFCAQFRQTIPDILCTIQTASTRYSVHNSVSQYQIFCAQFSQSVSDILCTIHTVSTRYSVHNSHSQYQISS